MGTSVVPRHDRAAAYHALASMSISKTLPGRPYGAGGAAAISIVTGVLTTSMPSNTKATAMAWYPGFRGSRDLWGRARVRSASSSPGARGRILAAALSGRGRRYHRPSSETRSAWTGCETSKANRRLLRLRRSSLKVTVSPALQRRLVGRRRHCSPSASGPQVGAVRTRRSGGWVGSFADRRQPGHENASKARTMEMRCPTLLISILSVAGPLEPCLALYANGCARPASMWPCPMMGLFAHLPKAFRTLLQRVKKRLRPDFSTLYPPKGDETAWVVRFGRNRRYPCNCYGNCEYRPIGGKSEVSVRCFCRRCYGVAVKSAI